MDAFMVPMEVSNVAIGFGMIIGSVAYALLAAARSRRMSLVVDVVL